MVLIGAFLVALVATPAAMRLARRVSLLDHPGDLKIQGHAVPYLGGLGVAAGLAVGVLPARAALLIPVALALALGIVDDARSVVPKVRFVAEVAIGLAVALLLPVRMPGVLGAVGVILVVVVLINGVNMIDGLDGLAGGVALMSALGFALILDGDGRVVALALAGGLAGFLVFNKPPAKVYMGDGGAYLVGTALAVLLCLAWADREPLAVSAGALPLVACPVADLGCAVLRRLRMHAPLFAGDRSHPYDRLVDAGWSHERTVATYIAAQAVLSAVGIAATRLSSSSAVAVAVAVGLAIVSLGTALAWRPMSRPTGPKAAA